MSQRREEGETPPLLSHLLAAVECLLIVLMIKGQTLKTFDLCDADLCQMRA
jgi:hypothetical protein